MPVSFDKIQQDAPGLVSLAKTAAASLDKHGLTGRRMAVYLVLDHSGSMSPFYADGSVQRLAEQALGLSVNLDDDGVVPLVFFGSYVEQYDDVRLDNYAGIVDRIHPKVHWGSTNYVAAMEATIAEHENSGATDPALVIFQTDGEPNDRRAVEKLLKKASELPIFWAFIGFGRHVEFLEKLDGLRVGFGGRKVDNAGFFHARTPHQVTDEELLDGVTRELPAWLRAASNAGVIR